MATHLPIRFCAHGSAAGPAYAAPTASARRRRTASVIARAATALTWLVAMTASFLPVLVILVIGLILALG